MTQEGKMGKKTTNKKTTKPIDKGVSTESVPRIPIFSKGDFAFKGDSLIQIDEVLWSEELNCFRYAIFYTQGTKMEPCADVFQVGGGGSCYWSEDEIKPITDPILLLRYALTKEYKSVERAEQNIRYSNMRIESLRIALETILPLPEARRRRSDEDSFRKCWSRSFMLSS